MTYRRGDQHLYSAHRQISVHLCFKHDTSDRCNRTAKTRLQNRPSEAPQSLLSPGERKERAASMKGTADASLWTLTSIYSPTQHISITKCANLEHLQFGHQASRWYRLSFPPCMNHIGLSGTRHPAVRERRPHSASP